MEDSWLRGRTGSDLGGSWGKESCVKRLLTGDNRIQSMVDIKGWVNNLLFYSIVLYIISRG